MKIHTNDVNSVLSVLKEIGMKGTVKENYHKFFPLENDYWFNLPEFVWDPNLTERKVVIVKTKTKEDNLELFEGFKMKPVNKNYFYYNFKKDENDYWYEYTHKIVPKYPIYVITKGRWEKTYTIDTLEEMGVDFILCVEPKEYDNYCSNPKIDKNKILILPENFSERNLGSIPVRNFVWEHSVKNGHTKHWILDDNIQWFYRWNRNKKLKVTDGVFFRIMEDFSDRYENIGLTSCQYKQFIPQMYSDRQQICVNTRCYSCILINTELLDKRLDERWRGRYNEDTDLTLRVLSLGDICTVNFNCLQSGKHTTGSVKGGNEEIYDGHKHSGYQKKFDELKTNWGDIVTYTDKRHKDGRPHHSIKYTTHFTQKLKIKDGIVREPFINNYNMILKHGPKKI